MIFIGLITWNIHFFCLNFQIGDNKANDWKKMWPPSSMGEGLSGRANKKRPFFTATQRIHIICARINFSFAMTYSLALAISSSNLAKSNWTFAGQKRRRKNRLYIYSRINNLHQGGGRGKWNKWPVKIARRAWYTNIYGTFSRNKYIM